MIRYDISFTKNSELKKWFSTTIGVRYWRDYILYSFGVILYNKLRFIDDKI